MPVKRVPDPADHSWMAQQAVLLEADKRSEPALVAVLPRLLSLESLLTGLATSVAVKLHGPLADAGGEPGHIDGRRLVILDRMAHVRSMVDEVVAALREEDEP